MIFQSEKVLAQWDTWLFFHEGIHHLYYLITQRKGSDRQNLFEGIGMATSKDGVHFDDIGPVIEPSRQMVHFLGTGSVWKDPDFASTGRFYMNYSEYRQDGEGKTQNIFFAQSIDLIHWEKYGDEKMFRVDTSLYERLGRWDCINTYPREEGGLWGNWTATPLGRGSEKNGIGMGYSEDGLNWVALPPPTVEPEADEAGDIIERDGHWYSLFGRRGDMVIYTSDAITGPYIQQKKNPRLTKGPHTYFARLYSCDGELLLNHHSMDGKKIHSARGDISETYLAPLKKVIFDSEGTLRVVYWRGNDALKGPAILLDDEAGPDGSRFLSQPADFAGGIFIEGETVLSDNPTILLFADHMSFAINLSRRRISFGDNGLFSGAYTERQWCDRDRDFPASSSFKLLARSGMAELYLDGEFVECWRLGCPDAQLIRPAVRGEIADVRIYSMTLKENSDDNDPLSNDR